jgi:hypothetical protein
MGDVEAPNARMVEAKHEAKWPLRGLATKHECGPNQPPQEVPYEHRPYWPPETSYEHDPSILKSTGNCKPEDELATLKTAAPGHPDMRSQHREGGIQEGFGRPREAQQKSRALSPHEKKEKANKNKVSMVSIYYARAEGCHQRHCHCWRDKASYRLDDAATGKSRSPSHTSSHTLA